MRGGALGAVTLKALVQLESFRSKRMRGGGGGWKRRGRLGIPRREKRQKRQVKAGGMVAGAGGLVEAWICWCDWRDWTQLTASYHFADVLEEDIGQRV